MRPHQSGGLCAVAVRDRRRRDLGHRPGLTRQASGDGRRERDASAQPRPASHARGSDRCGRADHPRPARHGLPAAGDGAGAAGGLCSGARALQPDHHTDGAGRGGGGTRDSARRGEKLRREGLGTDHVTIFYHTSEHGRDEPIRSVSTTARRQEHGSDTLALIKAARHRTTQVSDLLHSRSHAAARAMVH